MVGLLMVGFVANLLVRPVSSKYHEPETAYPPSRPSAGVAGSSGSTTSGAGTLTQEARR